MIPFVVLVAALSVVIYVFGTDALSGASQVALMFAAGVTGCSKSPIDLLKGAGVDMTDPAPVNDALKLFGELLDEMEALMQE